MKPTPATGPARRLTDSRFLNLFTTDVRTDKGARPWIFASRKENPLVGTPTADAVAMIVVVNDGNEPRLLVTREFRAPLGRCELAFPAGLIDAGESAAAAAARELFEETGLTLTKITHISPPVASSAGLTDETVCLVYGEATGSISRDHQDQHEQIDARLISFPEICALLKNPPDDVFSVRLYAALVGFVTAGAIVLPPT